MGRRVSLVGIKTYESTKDIDLTTAQKVNS